MSKAAISEKEVKKIFKDLNIDQEENRSKILEMNKLHEEFFPKKKPVFILLESSSH